MKLKIIIDGKTYDVEVQEAEDAGAAESSAAAIQSAVLPSAKHSATSDFDESKVCRAPLAGVLSRVHVSPGQQVEANALLVVLEAMKMEIKIPAERAGIVQSIEVAPGDAVRPNQILIFFK